MSLDKYTGHKKHAGLYHKIINQIPKIRLNYYELFAGSASIYSLITEPHGFNGVLNDLDAEVHKKLVKQYRDAMVIKANAIHLLKSWKFLEGEFIFLDPPYHHSTRPNATDLYKHELTNDDHIKLLNAVQDLKCNIMIIHPKCDLYDSMLSSWRKIEIKVRYHKKTSIEVLYMNYAEPLQLQDYSYLGKDCWDRQRIDRKVKSYVSKFTKLPVLERNCILEKLNQII